MHRYLHFIDMKVSMAVLTGTAGELPRCRRWDPAHGVGTKAAVGQQCCDPGGWFVLPLCTQPRPVSSLQRKKEITAMELSLLVTRDCILQVKIMHY